MLGDAIRRRAPPEGPRSVFSEHHQPFLFSGRRGRVSPEAFSGGNLVLYPAGIVVIYIVLRYCSTRASPSPHDPLDPLPSGRHRRAACAPPRGLDLIGVPGLVGTLLLMGIVKKKRHGLSIFANRDPRDQGLAPEPRYARLRCCRFPAPSLNDDRLAAFALPRFRSCCHGARQRTATPLRVLPWSLGFLLSQAVTLYTHPCHLPREWRASRGGLPRRRRQLRRITSLGNPSSGRVPIATALLPVRRGSRGESWPSFNLPVRRCRVWISHRRRPPASQPGAIPQQMALAVAPHLTLERRLGTFARRHEMTSNPRPLVATLVVRAISNLPPRSVDAAARTSWRRSNAQGSDLPAVLRIPSIPKVPTPGETHFCSFPLAMTAIGLTPRHDLRCGPR